MNTPQGPILVVEDVANILELLQVTLQFKGYSVRTATDGQEALEIIKNELPALVISDILMPKMDGFAMAQQMRTDPKTSQIPIIFFSATYVTPEDKAFALSLGAVRFLEKPVDTEDFLLTVAEVLTMGPSSIPSPMGEAEFYKGYRERLENKLLYKNTQIARSERLMKMLPEAQKPAFRTMLEEEYSHRDEIQRELDELYRLLKG